MMKQRIWNSILGIGALMGLLVICFVGFGAEQHITREQEVLNFTAPELTERYRNQGLPADTVLDGIPDEVTENQVTFCDRVMSLCQWTEDDTQYTQLVIQEFLAALQQKNPDIHAYVSVMPLRIACDAPFGTDEDYLELVKAQGQKIRKIEQTLLAQLGDAAVPVFDALKEHEQEYIFYRGESVWTARGAYYAVQEFLKKDGLDTFPITDFWEYAKIFDIHDRHYYYLFEGRNPLILQKKKDGTTQKTPMVSALRSGSAVFLGNVTKGNYLDGFVHNGRKLLILGENGTNVLAPWFVTSFEQIVQIDLRYFSLMPGSLDALLQENGITDVYLLVNLDAGDYSERNSLPHITVRMNTLLEKPQEG